MELKVTGIGLTATEAGSYYTRIHYMELKEGAGEPGPRPPGRRIHYMELKADRGQGARGCWRWRIHYMELKVSLSGR